MLALVERDRVVEAVGDDIDKALVRRIIKSCEKVNNPLREVAHTLAFTSEPDTSTVVTIYQL